MFDFVRKHTKIMQFLLFLLIFPSFVLFGLEGYNRFRDKGDAVATVDGHDIFQAEWDGAHRQETDRLRQSMPGVDTKMFDSPEARYATLERLVRERVLVAAAQKARLTAGDQRLARELQQNPNVAALRGPDGKLDVARYRQLLAAQGMSPEMFEARVRDEISQRQVLAGLTGSALATAAQAAPSLNAFFEQREVQVARFAATDYASRVSPTEADLEAYYKANPTQFQATEQASIEYLVLDIDAIKKSIPINEQDLKTYYEQNSGRLSGQEERRASHILIAAAKDAPAADRDKAKARATELAAAVRKAPDSFAELARKNSQDPGSAVNGGDLDFFTRGAMTKPFEDAVFAMKKGEITGPVETEFGYHVIRLTDLRSPKQRSYEEVRPEIEAELRKQQAQRKFAESAEAFTNGVYEQSDSLKSVAEKLKLEIRTATGLTRAPKAGASGALANPRFLTAIFSSDSIEKKRNTEAVELGPNQLASGRITQYTAARTLPLAEVKDAVRQKLVADRAAELARKDGADKLAAWKAKPADAGLAAAVTVSRMDPKGVAVQVVDAALRADPTSLPSMAGVDLGAQGYAVVRVNKVVARPVPDEKAAAQERSQYAQAWAGAEGQAYYEMLKERFKVKIVAPKPKADDTAARAP